MPGMSRDEFLQEYDLKVDVEFELDGKPAEWAPSTSGKAQLWGEERRALNLEPQGGRQSAEMALSPDNAVLAIATNAVIRIYTYEEKMLRAELVGHTSNIGHIFFAPSETPKPANAKYLLLSDSRHMEDRQDKSCIIAWHLDDQGKLLNRTMPFAVEHLADTAIDAISGDLISHHDLSKHAIAEIRKELVETLKTADTKNRVAGLPSVQGNFSTFGSKPISRDGSKFFHIAHGTTTQHGMRDPDELPQLIVRPLPDMKPEICRLKGHTDAIMWASFSPADDGIIATAAWDGTYRIWNAHTGTCIHELGHTGNQNWSGDFSPDGKHVLLAGTNNVNIYDVATGEQVMKLEREKNEEGEGGLAAWIRYLSWSPTGDAIALCNSSSILLWQPFDLKGKILNKVDEIFRLTKPEKKIAEGFQSLYKVRWLDAQGERLVVGNGDHTLFVWDRKNNWHWRFQRPKGLALQMYSSEVLYIEETETLVSLDGDLKVREWKL